jgi:hypothetical protein
MVESRISRAKVAGRKVRAAIIPIKTACVTETAERGRMVRAKALVF